MKKAKHMILLALIVNITLGACKKNDIKTVTTLNNEDYFKMDEASIATRKAKIKRAKDFYTKTMANKVAIETLDEGAPDWAAVYMAYVPGKGEAVLVPVDFTTDNYYQLAGSIEKLDGENVTKVWMYETSPGVFTMQYITALLPTTGSNKESYLIKNLIDGTEKIQIQENGITYQSSVTKSYIPGGNTTTTTMVHCDKFDRYEVIKDQFTGATISENYLYSYQVCEVVAVYTGGDDGTGGGSVGFDPSDDDDEVEVTKDLVEWFVGGNYLFYNPNTYAKYTVVSWESFKGMQNKKDPSKNRFTAITHTPSKINSANCMNMQVVYNETAYTSTIVAQTWANIKVMGQATATGVWRNPIDYTPIPIFNIDPINGPQIFTFEQFFP